MRLALAALLTVLATPALAQFPPPGVYVCIGPDNEAFGTLALLPAGDYGFTTPDGIEHTGQVASSGNDVRAVTGILFDAHHLTGSFTEGESGAVTFDFQSDAGPVTCLTPP